MKIIIFLFVVLFVTINYARVFEGQCRGRPVPVVRPFNYKLYLGAWYEVGNQGLYILNERLFMFFF